MKFASTFFALLLTAFVAATSSFAADPEIQAPQADRASCSSREDAWKFRHGAYMLSAPASRSVNGSNLTFTVKVEQFRCVAKADGSVEQIVTGPKDDYSYDVIQKDGSTKHITLKRHNLKILAVASENNYAVLSSSDIVDGGGNPAIASTQAIRGGNYSAQISINIQDLLSDTQKRSLQTRGTIRAKVYLVEQAIIEYVDENGVSGGPNLATGGGFYLNFDIHWNGGEKYEVSNVTL